MSDNYEKRVGNIDTNESQSKGDQKKVLTTVKTQNLQIRKIEPKRPISAPTQEPLEKLPPRPNSAPSTRRDQNNMTKTASYRAHKILEEARSMKQHNGEVSTQVPTRVRITVAQLIQILRQEANKFGGQTQERTKSMQVVNSNSLNKTNAQKQGPSMGGGRAKTSGGQNSAR